MCSSDLLGAATGRTALVDAKPGGGTTIGSLEVSRAKPDGNTVLYTTGGHTTNAILMRRLPYDPIEGFTPIMLMARSQGFGLMVPGTSRFRTLQEFIAAAKAEPGKINYGSSGIGNTTHVVGELFCRSAGVQLTHVPYKGAGPALTDVVAGHIPFTMAGQSGVIPVLKDKRASAERRFCPCDNARTGNPQHAARPNAANASRADAVVVQRPEIAQAMHKFSVAERSSFRALA